MSLGSPSDPMLILNIKKQKQTNKTLRKQLRPNSLSTKTHQTLESSALWEFELYEIERLGISPVFQKGRCRLLGMFWGCFWNKQSMRMEERRYYQWTKARTAPERFRCWVIYILILHSKATRRVRKAGKVLQSISGS